MKWWNRFFSPKEETIKKVFTEAEQERHYVWKKAGLERLLGPMHDLVGHAIIPFEVGGSLDMYYFLQHIKGTGFATMELIDPAGDGPKANSLGTYELVAFTKYDYDDGTEEDTPFHLIEREVCHFLTAIGRYAFDAILHPLETMEIPGSEGQDATHILFDLYQAKGQTFTIGDQDHHLLLCMRVHATEMAFALNEGSQALIDLLKDARHYPYSDLDRAPVV